MRFSEFIKEATNGISHADLTKKVAKMYASHKAGNADFETVKLQKNVHTGATKHTSGSVKAHSLAYRPISKGFYATKTYIPHPMLNQVRLLIKKHGGTTLGHASEGDEGGFIDTNDGYRHHFGRQIGSNYSTFDHSVSKK
jgi:hypothetical protein